jgi:hypothetical protein
VAGQEGDLGLSDAGVLAQDGSNSTVGASLSDNS